MEILTFIVALAGAFAWLPQIFNFFTRPKLFGKIISRYNNLSENSTFFLFKLTLLFKNKSFSPKEIKCEIEYEDGLKYSDNARNMRIVFFQNEIFSKIENNQPVWIQKNQKLMVHGKEFLNNFANFEKDRANDGYLIFQFEHVKKDTKIVRTTFIFKSFDGREIELVFNEKDIDSRQILYDDNIWQ